MQLFNLLLFGLPGFSPCALPNSTSVTNFLHFTGQVFKNHRNWLQLHCYYFPLSYTFQSIKLRAARYSVKIQIGLFAAHTIFIASKDVIHLLGEKLPQGVAQSIH